MTTNVLLGKETANNFTYLYIHTETCSLPKSQFPIFSLIQAFWVFAYTNWSAYTFVPHQ